MRRSLRNVLLQSALACVQALRRVKGKPAMKTHIDCISSKRVIRLPGKPLTTFWSTNTPASFTHCGESASYLCPFVSMVFHRIVGSTGLVIEKVASLSPGRSWWRIFLSRVNFVCWLLFSVCSTPVLPKWHIETLVILPKVHLNVLTPKTQWSQSGLTMLSMHSVGTCYWGKQAHMQLVREPSAAVISGCWATVDWSWPKKWNCWAWADLHLKKKKSAGGEWIVKPSPRSSKAR